MSAPDPNDCTRPYTHRPHSRRKWGTNESTWCSGNGVSSGKPDGEHIVLVGFNVLAPDWHEAQRRLATVLPKPDGQGPVECWWIAEDDRIDGSDNHSAVFVPMGEQQATSDWLTHNPLPSPEPHPRYVVLVGNPGQALTLYGPFEEHEDAVTFANDTFRDQSWTVDALMGTLA